MSGLLHSSFGVFPLSANVVVSVSLYACCDVCDRSRCRIALLLLSLLNCACAQLSLTPFLLLSFFFRSNSNCNYSQSACASAISLRSATAPSILCCRRAHSLSFASHSLLLLSLLHSPLLLRLHASRSPSCSSHVSSSALESCLISPPSVVIRTTIKVVVHP